MVPSPSLKQLLRGLCHCEPWEYAVFWKLNRRGCMMLRWEEGYCENTKPFDPPKIMEHGEFYDHLSSTSVMVSHVVQAQYQIGLAVSEMSSHQYSLGNGIVGNVASSGKYQWLSLSDINSEILKRCPDEWQHQFAAGIKTVLLIPVGSPCAGVVQLGSSKLVEEETMVVTGIKKYFDSLYDDSWGSTSIELNEDDLRTYAKSPLSMKVLKGLDVEHMAEKEQTTSYYGFPMPINESFFLQTNASNMAAMDVHIPCENSWGAMYNFSELVPNEESLYLDRCFDISDSFTIECKSSNLTPEDLLFTLPQCNNGTSSFFSGLSALLNSCNTEVKHEESGSCLSANEIGQPIITEMLGTTTNEINGDISNICSQSLREGFLYDNDDYVPNSAMEDHWLASSANHGTSISDIERVFINENDVQHLINSLVAELYDSSGVVVPDASSQERSPGDHPGEVISCCQAESISQIDPPYMDNLVSPCQSNHGASSGSGTSTLLNSPTGSSSSMNGSTLINEEKPCQMDLEKAKKSVLVGKKRPKPDDSQRPRPRDRQLIQDRVKELRDLVPNGKKCSIDALLDRTIKHMLFLRSISSQAEKLKICSRSKVLGPDREPLEFEDENYGVTWAYELDSQPEACPIVVKDLDQQGHMLVEMLCTEYGDFLEIAQVMRRLRLTILKGVMESRAEKLWAHFVVEASKGFNRMEILWPLMQLLQQNRIPLTSRF